MNRTALLAGATGLVGGYVLDHLLRSDNYERVLTLTRRPLQRTHPKHENRIVDFDRLEEHAPRIGADDVFCCLGTTMKQAGSREAFERVDLDYPTTLARLASAGGAKQFLLVSSMGADPRSLFFYSRVKGRTEERVSAFPFTSVFLFRPSLLLGERDERRPGEAAAERILKGLAPVLRGPLGRLKPIRAEAVARVMVRMADMGLPGVHVVESQEIDRLSPAE